MWHSRRGSHGNSSMKTQALPIFANLPRPALAGFAVDPPSFLVLALEGGKGDAF